MFYLGFEFEEGCLQLRRDLRDEGVVRKARIERKPVAGMGGKADEG
jgi:hypothetical protein